MYYPRKADSVADLVNTEDKSHLEPKTFSNTIIAIELICTNLLPFCSPASFLCLSRTCRSVRAAVREYMRRSFKINRILSRFFTSPLSFRQIQAETGTLIFGSSILQFFDRSFYPKSDLDIYVPSTKEHETLTVANFLLKEGYKYVPDSGQHVDFNVAASGDMFNDSDVDKVIEVFAFNKYSEGGDILRIELMVSRHNPIDVILMFHSSGST